MGEDLKNPRHDPKPEVLRWLEEKAKEELMHRYAPETGPICDTCGFHLLETPDCKLSCKNCGYRRDCTDP